MSEPLLLESPPSTADQPKKLSPDKLAHRYKEKAERMKMASGWLRTFTLVVALIGMALVFFEFVFRFWHINVGSFYRSGAFSIYVVAAALAIGSYAYSNVTVLTITVISGITAIAAAATITIIEGIRVNQCCCGTPATMFDNTICTSEPGLYYINLIYAGAYLLLSLVQTILAWVWLGRAEQIHNDVTTAEILNARGKIMSTLPQHTSKEAIASRMFAIGLNTKAKLRYTAQQLNVFYLGSLALNYAHLVIGVLGGLFLLALVIIEVFTLNDAWSLRLDLMNVAGISFGFSLATWGTVGPVWPWFIIVADAVGLAGTITAAVFEVARQDRCPSFTNVYEQTICSEGTSGSIVPISSIVLSIMLVASLVVAIFSLVYQRSVRRAQE